MKIKKLLAAAFFCAAILCAMSVTGFAEGSDVVYVNTNYTNDTAVTRVDQAVGNDDNDGTEEYPVATIAKALELVNENGTIYVKGGLRSVAGLNTVVYKPVTIVGLEEDGNYVTFQYPLPTAAGTVTYKNFNFYKANIFTGSSGVDYSQLDLVVDGCDFISGGNAAMNVARPIKSITVQNCSFYTDGLTSYAKQYMVWAYDAKSIVIDNNNIGYKINVSSNTIKDLHLGNMAKIYTKLIVREDDMSLCGFATKEEMKMFELLTSVSKIGPKVGLSILSFASPGQLGAYILSEDVAKLSKAPGVGKKTAERIVLELKDKVDKNNVEFEPTLLSSEPIAVSKDEAVDALVALGYSSAEAKEAVDKCKKDGLNTEDIIKKSLTYIMSKSLR